MKRFDKRIIKIISLSLYTYEKIAEPDYKFHNLHSHYYTWGNLIFKKTGYLKAGHDWHFMKAGFDKVSCILNFKAKYIECSSIIQDALESIHKDNMIFINGQELSYEDECSAVDKLLTEFEEINNVI